MRTVIVSLFAATLLVVSAAAQPPAEHGPGMGFDMPPAEGGASRAEHRLRFLSRALDLTDEQVAAAKALFQDMVAATEPLIQEMRQLRSDLQEALGAADPNPTNIGELALALHQQRQAVGEQREAFRASLEALLTPEQLEKLQDLEEMRPGHGRGRGGRGRHAPHWGGSPKP